MITIICGEDVVSSRAYFLSLCAKYEEEKSTVQYLTYSELPLLLEQAQYSTNLFDQKQVFLIHNLNKGVSAKSKSTLSYLEQIAGDDSIELIDWEDGTTARHLKFAHLAKVKEFKPAANIFKLADSCYPGNLKEFVTTLSILAKPTEEMLIYVVLMRHIRNILLAALGDPLTKLQSWQRAKVERQAKLWKRDTLIAFYDSLLRIDISLKSGKNIYGIKNSLDIAACFYLR